MSVSCVYLQMPEAARAVTDGSVFENELEETADFSVGKSVLTPFLYGRFQTGLHISAPFFHHEFLMAAAMKLPLPWTVTTNPSSSSRS